MSNSIKGSIVDVHPEGSESFRGCVTRVFIGDCKDNLIQVINLEFGTVFVAYDYEVSDYLIEDVNKLDNLKEVI